jgi:hypothetical protein
MIRTTDMLIASDTQVGLLSLILRNASTRKIRSTRASCPSPTRISSKPKSIKPFDLDDWLKRLLAFPASCVLAQDKPAAQTVSPGTESLETVKQKFQEARKAHVAEIRTPLHDARKNGNEKDSRSKKNFHDSFSRDNSWRSPRETQRAQRRSKLSR